MRPFIPPIGFFSSSPTGPHGPISFVGSGVFSDNTGIGSGLTFNFSSLLDASGSTPSIAANDIAIAVWVCHCNGVNVTIATPSGWTKDEDRYVNNGQDTNLGIFHKILTGLETSVTFDNSHSGSGSSAVAGVVFVFRGVDIVTPFDVANTFASGTSGSKPNAAAITPITTGSWIVVAGGGSQGTAAAFTNPGDLSTTTNHFRSSTGNGTNDAAAGIGIKTNWSSGAFDPAQWGGGTSLSFESWAAVTMALRSA